MKYGRGDKHAPTAYEIYIFGSYVCTVQIASELLLFANIYICLVYIRQMAAENDDSSS